MLRLTNPHALAYVPRIETMENLYIFSSFGWKVVFNHHNMFTHSIATRKAHTLLSLYLFQ